MLPHVASQPKRRAIHVIAGNLSTHETQAVRTFLLEHPNVRLLFTPTYSSWLNQVELWFAKIERAGGQELVAGNAPPVTAMRSSVGFSVSTRPIRVASRVRR